MDIQLLLQQEQQSGNFCYTYTRTLQMAIVGYVAISGGVVLLACTIYHMIMTRRVNMISRNLLYIYVCVISQSMFYESKWSISEMMYFTYRDRPDVDDKYIQLAQISKFVLLSEVLQIFTIQTMLILVFYNWIEKIVDLMQNLSQFQVGNCKKINQYLRFQIICRKIITLYLIFRVVPYGLIIFFTFSIGQGFNGLLLKLSFLFMLIQAFLIPILLGLGIFAIKRSTKLIQIIDSSQIKTLINRYIVLIVCTIFRFGIGLFDAYLQVKDNHFNQRCILEDQQLKNNIIIKLILMIFSDIIMYYIPVIIVLRIFKVNSENRLTDSLIQSLKHESIHEDIMYTS